MIEDRILTRALLERLLEIEGSLAQGASATIQPPVEGMYVPNALSIPGYGGKQIEDHLNFYVRSLIELTWPRRIYVSLPRTR